MAVCSVSAQFECDIEKVWNTVTSPENYRWRSDLSRIERIDDNRFAEYTKDGFVTEFTVTAEKFCSLWEFDIENQNIKGHWKGEFWQEDGVSKITFTENVTAKKFFIRPILKAYLKRQQKLYISDLKKALHN